MLKLALWATLLSPRLFAGPFVPGSALPMELAETPWTGSLQAWSADPTFSAELGLELKDDIHYRLLGDLLELGDTPFSKVERLAAPAERAKEVRQAVVLSVRKLVEHEKKISTQKRSPKQLAQFEAVSIRYWNLKLLGPKALEILPEADRQAMQDSSQRAAQARMSVLAEMPGFDQLKEHIQHRQALADAESAEEETGSLPESVRNDLEKPRALDRLDGLRAVRDSGGPAAHEAAIHVLSKDPDWYNKREAARMLGQAAESIGARKDRVVEALTEATMHENESVRIMADWALEKLGAPPALEAMLKKADLIEIPPEVDERLNRRIQEALHIEQLRKEIASAPEGRDEMLGGTSRRYVLDEKAIFEGPKAAVFKMAVAMSSVGLALILFGLPAGHLVAGFVRLAVVASLFGLMGYAGFVGFVKIQIAKARAANLEADEAEVRYRVHVDADNIRLTPEQLARRKFLTEAEWEAAKERVRKARASA